MRSQGDHPAKGPILTTRISGFLDFSAQSDSTHLRQMSERPASTQAAHLWFERNPRLSCGLAAARLDKATRPHATSDWVIACDGWLAQQDDASCAPTSPLRTLLERGPTHFAQLDGEFALAAINLDTEQGYLVRDRWGTKPLYYSWLGPLLLFGSDLRSLTAHPALPVVLDRDQVAAYFAFDAVPTPYSILKQVRKLTPGHALVIDFARRRSSEIGYWHLADGLNSPADPLTEADAKQALYRLFSAAVLRRQQRYPGAGVFLTSGYDSTLIAALLQRASSTPIPTFCVGFDEPSLDEAPHAAAVAARIGCRHTTIVCRAEDVSRLTVELPDVYDEPLGVHSLVPTLAGWLAASREVPGLYAGDGSSTLIGPGNPHLLFGPHDPPDWSAHDHAAADTLLVHRAGRGAALQYATDSELAALLRFDYVLPTGHYQSLDRLAPAANRLQHASNVIHHGEQARSASDRMFPRVDRAAHRYQSTALYPFTDNAFLDFALRLPARFKYHGGESKYLFKQVVRDVVGADVMKQPKMGFESPNWQWLNTGCTGLLNDYLSRDALRSHGLFNLDEINRLRHALTHAADLDVRKRSASRLRQVLYLQLWIERWRHYGLQT
jgi:asparagine synthase (glutamine-hydrolysing)